MKERTYIMRFEEPTMEIIEVNAKDITTNMSGENYSTEDSLKTSWS